mmetsp:Transcript_42638/g.40929  ORF Transcript_42638/g.40929 Transcript_42638/m.40929 type:complete len:113 (+) Transcript_42638:342-680(+)
MVHPSVVGVVLGQLVGGVLVRERRQEVQRRVLLTLPTPAPIKVLLSIPQDTLVVVEEDHVAALFALFVLGEGPFVLADPHLGCSFVLGRWPYGGPNHIMLGVVLGGVLLVQG